jgi:alkaline phosphatase D
MDRREFLGLALGSACAPLLLSGCGDINTWRNEDVAERVDFPTGLCAGSPTENGIQLVAHVTGLVGVARLGLEIAEDPNFDFPVQLGVLEGTLATLDAPWHTRVGGLQPAHTYYYRFGTRSGLSPVGRFTTLPLPSDPRPIRLAFFSCQGWQAGYYTAHRAMSLEPDLQLALCLGDYIYELTDDFGPADRVDNVGNAGFCETLAEYRQKYTLYRSDPDLQAMHAAHSFLAVWDNHELADDDPGHLRGRTPRVPLPERKANGKRAFFDFMPMEPGAPGHLYRSLRIGDGVELFLLDLHSEAAPPASGGTYLGPAQLAWLLEGLRTSSARWKLLASSTVMVGLELAPGQPINTNQWDGYPAERRRIVEHIREYDIKGVVALTGDLHTFIVGTVTDTGRSDGEPGLIEFCGGAISSQGLLNLEPDQTDLARALEMEGLTRNPHISFLDVLQRGYGVVEARGDELIVTFRSVDTVLERGSAVRDLARFRIRHGTLSAERI